MTKSGTKRMSAEMRRKIPELLSRYVESCRPPPGTEEKKPISRLPNLAGFCRYIGCGMSEIEALKVRDVSLWEHIVAVLEDELLNYVPSATLLSHYLKKRLGYEEEHQEVKETDCGQVRLIFEHDIEEDGA